MNPKIINSMNARLARLEALLENSDVFKAQGGTTYGGLQYEGSQYNYNFEGASQGFGPQMLDQQLAQNYGFGPSDMAIFEMQQRIAELELLVAGGSNDTNQGGALDAGAAVGDDGERGTGESGNFGTMANQDADSVEITGGTLSGITSIGLGSGAEESTIVNNGGTMSLSAPGGGILLNGPLVRVGSNGYNLGFYGSSGTSQLTINGSVSGATAAVLSALLQALGQGNLNLVNDNTTP